jgi:hypothetical protein
VHDLFLKAGLLLSGEVSLDGEYPSVSACLRSQIDESTSVQFVFHHPAIGQLQGMTYREPPGGQHEVGGHTGHLLTSVSPLAVPLLPAGHSIWLIASCFYCNTQLFKSFGIEKMGLFEFVKAEVIKSIRAKKEKGLQSHITRGRFFILKL